MPISSAREAVELGWSHHRAGRFAEAEALYRQALALEPGHPDAIHLLGVLAIRFNRPQLALDLLTRAVAANGDAPAYRDSLGQALSACRRFEEAIGEFERAIQLQPEFAQTHHNLAAALISLGRFEQATDALRRALELQPDLIDAASDLGGCLCQLGRLTSAIETYRAALARRPDLPALHYNLATALLLNGELPEGFAEYEYRRAAKRRTPPAFTQPLWDGGDLRGKRILVYFEQGFGDAIQFVRYLPLLARRAERVKFWSPQPLERLMHSMPQIELIPASQTPADFDVQCPLLSLPARFGTTLQTIPADIPYLHADEALWARWADRLGPGDGRLKVGLVWAGRPGHKDDTRRSLSLPQFAPLASREVRFFSLQFGPASEQAKTPPEGMSLADWTAELADFADSAALLEHLDLLITVDTAAAHLAGAIGKPVWLLLPFVPDWRWMLLRDDSPWYPTMRLFRQATPGQWEPVIEAVARSLAQ